MAFDPSGKHLTDVVFTAHNMACTTWGGKDFDTLYVATGINKSADARADDEGGHMFWYKPERARGQAKFEFDG